MIQLTDFQEQSFTKMEDLRDTIASQNRGVYEAPLNKISLSKDGTLHAGTFEGPMAESGLRGLLHIEGAPEDFVMKRCPKDLSLEIVLRLAHQASTLINVLATNGVATAIIPADRQPIRHDMLIDWLGVDRPIKEAVLTNDLLRITAVSNKPTELLPDDTFDFGWELINSENGQCTEAWRWAVREVCTNGLVRFDKKPVFKRAYNSRISIPDFLHRLIHILENEIKPPELEPAIKWAADMRVGSDNKDIIKYLSQRLGGDATKMELENVNPDTSWYELLNHITSLARLHSLDLRRRYEAEGGMLLRWFLRKGHGKPPWRRMLCDECQAWNISEPEQIMSEDKTE